MSPRWAQHTKQQVEEIERLGGELGKATDTMERLNTTVRKQSASIDAVESDLKDSKADLSLGAGQGRGRQAPKARDAETFENDRSLIEEVIGQRDQHGGAASALKTQLKTEREAHNRTEAALVWRARLLKVMLAVCLVLAVLVLLSSYRSRGINAKKAWTGQEHRMRLKMQLNQFGALYKRDRPHSA
ncbi:hypothetical protein ACFVVM_05595 [Nocardia sp. NPDC058176]|uniref:hypothetical protein n=1 Tax=Nocardia sp. NPDC058176 TaxID=3346368 RepID=UPI0036DEDF29